MDAHDGHGTGLWGAGPQKALLLPVIQIFQELFQTAQVAPLIFRRHLEEQAKVFLGIVSLGLGPVDGIQPCGKVNVLQ